MALRTSTFRHGWVWVGACTLAVVWLAGSLLWFSSRFDWIPLFGAEPAQEAPPPSPQAAPGDDPVLPPPAVELAAEIADASESLHPVTEVGFVAGPNAWRCGVHTAPLYGEYRTTGQATVSVLVHPPGFGAAVFDEEMNRLRTCTSRTRADVLAEAPASAVLRSERGVEWWWRRGDVLMRVTSTERTQPATDIAAATNDFTVEDSEVVVLPPVVDAALVAARVDEVAARVLDGVCADQFAGVDAQNRNPLYEGFTGLLVTEAVDVSEISELGSDARSIAAAPPPASTSTSSTSTTTVADPGVESPVVYDVAFYESLEVDDPALVPEPANPYQRFPSRPSAVKEAPVSKTFEVRAPDDVGPGCGWAFTGFAAPFVDVELLTAQRVELRRDALVRLDAEVFEAQFDGLRYAEEVAVFEDRLARYEVWRAYQAALSRARVRAEPPPTTTTTTTTTTTVPPTTAPPTTQPPTTTVPPTTAPPSTTTTTTTVP